MGWQTPQNSKILIKPVILLVFIRPKTVKTLREGMGIKSINETFHSCHFYAFLL